MPSTRYFSFLPLFILLFSLPAAPAICEPGFRAEPPLLSSDTSRPHILLPGVSPYLIAQKQWELQTFGSFSSQKLENRSDTEDQLRLTGGNYFFLFMLGIDPGQRFNVGIEAQLGTLRQTPADDDPATLPNQYQGLSALGLRVRSAPIASLPELTFQGALLLPTASDRLTRQALGRDRMQLLVQANIYQQVQPWLYVFLQADASMLLKNRERQQTTYSFPVSLYAVGEILDQGLYLIPSLSYVGVYTPSYKGPLLTSGSQLLGGLSVQYAFSPRVSINVQGQTALSYRQKSQTYDYIAGSYALFSLGLRCVN